MKAAFPPIIDDKSSVLILGTMPGEESLRLQQYYGNKGNAFWKLLFTIFEAEFTTDFGQRVALLNKHGIALWDVLSSCERHGSLDSNIRNEVANDFTSFFDRYPNIRSVVFSSKQAAKYYDKYSQRKSDLDYYVLPSPSGANARMTFLQKLDEWHLLSKLIN